MKNPNILNDFVANKGIYFLNHSVGRPLVQAEENLQKQFFEAWQNGEPWGKWITVFAEFQRALANLFHSEANNFCPQINLSSALTKILFSIPKRKGKQCILLSENDFPSIGFVAEQAKNLGYELIFLPKNLDQTDANVWIEAFKKNVQWVLITQVQSNTGMQIPIQEIVKQANKQNIISVIDVAQAAGVLEIDIDSWQASFVIGSCVKWLCGGAGAGFLWANSNILQACKPVDVGWFSHENPFEFDIHHFEYHQTALRFWGGTPSVMPYILATQSINYLANIGIKNIRNHNLELTQKLIDSVPRKYIISPLENHKRSGTVILNVGEKQNFVVNELKNKDIQFDVRSLGMRISPHIYNTSEQMETFVELLKKAEKM